MPGLGRRPPRAYALTPPAWSEVDDPGPTLPLVITVAAVLVCLVLTGLAVFQALLALGAPLGRFAWGGQHRVLPARLRVGSLVSIGVYALIATVVLARVGLVSPDVSGQVIGTVTWVVVAYFFLGVGLNLASRSRPERSVMSPLSLVLCALCAVVALG